MAKETKEEERVVVKYNGPAGWDINYPTRGKQSVKPGETVSLNPHDPYELEALLSILKTVNGGRVNVRTELLKPNNEGVRELAHHHRFTVESGLGFLPEILQKIKYSGSGIYTDEERKAIEQVCPEYFKRPDMKRKIAF